MVAPDGKSFAAAADGWEDLLAKLKAEEVKANGNGWTLSGGVLVSPGSKVTPLVLPGNFARRSYAIRITGRRLSKGGLAVALPVGDKHTIFDFDYQPSSHSYQTGIGVLSGGITRKDMPETVSTRQVNDSEPHDLEISVSLGAKTAQIKAMLDDRPFYEWSGSAEDLQMPAHWPAITPSNLAIGANGGDWVISAVKVKPL